MIWSVTLNAGRGRTLNTQLTAPEVRDVFDYMADWEGSDTIRAGQMRDCEQVLALEVGASYVDDDRFRWTRLS